MKIFTGMQKQNKRNWGKFFNRGRKFCPTGTLRSVIAKINTVKTESIYGHFVASNLIIYNPTFYLTFTLQFLEERPLLIGSLISSWDIFSKCSLFFMNWKNSGWENKGEWIESEIHWFFSFDRKCSLLKLKFEHLAQDLWKLIVFVLKYQKNSDNYSMHNEKQKELISSMANFLHLQQYMSSILWFTYFRSVLVQNPFQWTSSLIGCSLHHALDHIVAKLMFG